MYLFFLVIVFFEIVLRAIDLSFDDRIAGIIGKSSFLKTENVENKKSGVIRHFTNINNRAKVPHPYLGHVYNRVTNNGINKDGFDELQDFDNIDKKKYYYIGIFGGSVAKNFANHQKKSSNGIINIFQNKIPHVLKGKKIRLINFGVSAYKQPQQFISISLFLDKIDMAIIIDGFNDVAFDFRKEFPANFPIYANYFFSLDPARNKYYVNLYELVSLRLSVADFFNKNKIFTFSKSIGSAWYLVDSFLERRINFLQLYFVPSLDKKNTYYSDSEKLGQDQKILASIWSKYSALQSQLLKANGVPYFHFIQPNQHVVGTKLLSLEERERYFDPRRVDRINAGYKEVLRKASYLRSEYKVFNLVKVFSEIGETVYSDPCCHLNDIGREYLANEISEIIIKNFNTSYFN